MSRHRFFGIEAAVAGRAAGADHDEGDLSRDIDELREAGWLAACLPSQYGGEGWGTEPAGTEAAFDALRSLGRANLSVARLFEGHMNAVKLVMLYGGENVRGEISGAVRDGALLGVWGADDPDHPLELNEDRNELRGAKRFASGLGLVQFALVTVPLDKGPQLLLMRADDPFRSDPSCWRMGGMKATNSGRYDFGGLKVDDDRRIGNPEDYLREPHFEGGIWRYCAAHLGAAEALHYAMRRQLIGRGRADDPHQQRRLVESAIAIETMRLWLLRAANAVEQADAPPEAATLSLLAREVTELNCRKVLQTVEQGLGMAAHSAGSPIERMKRDLSLFLCQAAPDAKRARAAEVLAHLEAGVESL